MFQVEPTALPEVLLITPQVFSDPRGLFEESWAVERYAVAGIDLPFVQDNYSRSRKPTLRGLHFQEPNPQGKLVMVFSGCVYDVVVDIRQGSPNFGKWIGVELNDQLMQQLWVPPGFAHGFCVLSDTAGFFYKCTERYQPDHQCAIRWNDPEIGIEWPVQAPLLSDQDGTAPLLSQASALPQYEKNL